MALRSMDADNRGFTTRGGWWVLAQVPVMQRLLHARFPEYTGYALRVRKLLPWIY